MIQLSQASFLDLARRFVSAEEFARWLIDNKVSLRAERAAQRAARSGQLSAEQVGLVESGLRVSVGLDPAGSGGNADSIGLARAPVSAEGLERPGVKLAVARKAVPFIPIKGDNAKQVLAALLDFCHSETLRCYPGMAHLALKLGRSGQKDPRRHIRRGVAQLVAAGLLKVAAHAGLKHSNAYFPQWERLAAIAARFESGDGVGQPDSADKVVPQSQKKIPTSVTPTRVQRATEPDRRQRQLPLVAVVPTGMPRQQAGLRVMQAITAHCRGRSARFVEQFRAEIGSDLLEAAISAEVRGRGAGIDVILDGLGPGPPAPLPEVSEALQARLRRG